MSNKMIKELIINTKVKNKKDLANLEKQIKDIDKSALKLNKAMKGNLPKSLKEFEQLRVQLQGVDSTMIDASNSASMFATKLTAGMAGATAAVATLAVGFQAMQQAARDVQLEKVADILGNQMIVDLENVAKGMQEASGYTMTFTEALRASTKAATFGFTSDEIQKMTVVARNASQVVGTDMVSAFDDLTAGIAKGETDLLDNLGLTVRVGDAYEAYAAKLGKTANSLSTFERQQAVTNYTIDQGTQKFGALSKATDATNLDKLAAVLREDTNKALKEASKYAESLANWLLKIRGESVDLSTPTENFLGLGDPKSLKDAVTYIQQYSKVREAQDKAMTTGGAFDPKWYESIPEYFKDIATGGNMVTAMFRAQSKEASSNFQAINKNEQVLKNLSGTLDTIVGKYNITADNLEQVTKLLQEQNTATTSVNSAESALSGTITNSQNVFANYANALRDQASVTQQLSQYDKTLKVEKQGLISTLNQAAGALNNYNQMALQASEMQLAGMSDTRVIDAQVKSIREYQDSLIKVGQESGKINQQEIDSLQIQVNNLLVQKREKLKQISDERARAAQDRLNEIKREQESMQDMEELRRQWIWQRKDAEMKSLDEIMAKEAERQRKETEFKKMQADGYMPGLTSGIGMNADDKGMVAGTERLQMFTDSMSQVTSQVDGLGAMTTAFQSLTLAASGFGESASSALQMTSVGLQGFAGMLKMVSNGAVASIDAQIQMEQKRDGKSKESQAKIKQLEAKKIKEQQKSAKQQILISTSVAMMNAAANPWPLPAIPLMAAAGAAGALALSQASSASSNQMAALNTESIASNASLSIGDRANAVNVGNRANAGELSYIRGDSGVGSIGSFTPRAEGGMMSPGMSYIVGEHGPEVISPITNMESTSNSDIKSGNNTNAVSNNVTFNITAMDAQSVMDRRQDIFDALQMSGEEQGIDFFKLR